ncbi:glyceraldehyde-3-phosphate dehydrogenase [Alteromonas aestuariivivens]|uniref:Glyceraldehyde-3-phosphate dehydrogenase n=1 Tax=Alteromonas aestuariivivens TaxID=1938339 RepID=A0A3D8MDD1_9ALTE|nr:BamA/TamA family outer membrane protein [Alteromonas aestuariivivens]RDV28193.1 glyceraldehyde-3-phosphate dehydrogenase [Alteromonas aestuariivivens]
MSTLGRRWIRLSTALRVTAMLFLVCGAAVAEDVQKMVLEPQDANLDMGQHLGQSGGGFVPIPQVISEPAVGYGLGVIGVYFHGDSQQPAAEEESLPQNISLLAAGLTENGSWAAGVGHLGFWRDDTVRYRGFAGYGDLNLSFYSLVGVTLPAPIQLNIKGPAVFQEIKYRWHGPWFIGAQYHFRRTESRLRVEANLPDELLSSTLEDWLERHLQSSQTTAGVGVVLDYDTLDSFFNPQSGSAYNLQYQWYRDHFGSDADYQLYKFKALNYWKIQTRLTLGLRLQYDGVQAEELSQLPNYVLPSIQLRGVSSTRYQGEVVGVTEMELGYQWSQNWRLSVFLGAGRAGTDFSALSKAPSVVNKGVGVRYQLVEQYDFYVGLDLARGPEETALYIQAGSTW